MSRKQMKKRFTSEVNIIDFQPYMPQKRRAVTLSPRNKSQRDYLRKLEDESKSIVFAIGPAGTGKAQPLYSKIKIPGGWTTMGNIKPGDKVSTPTGGVATVVELYPQGMKDTYIVELRDGRTTECCGEHLWEVFYTDNSIKPQIMSTIDIINFQLTHKKPLKIRLPMHEISNDIELPIDPYVLGSLLGDGSFSTYPRICVSSADSEIIDKLNRLCIGDGEFVYKHNYDYHYKSTNTVTHAYKKGEFSTKLQQSINELNLFGSKSNTKFIPDIYLNASKNQKIKLLKGLLDTDGYASNNNEVIYTTVSKDLCDAVIYLIRSIGGTAKVKSYISSYTYRGIKKEGQLVYDITICYNKKTELFSLPRKINRLSDDCQYSKSGTISIKSITPSGIKECQCILIDSQEHLYITDNFIVTHNTMLAVQYGIKLLQEGKIEKIIVTRPAVGADEDIGFLPGTLTEKMAPWTRPLFDYFEEYYHKKDITRFLEDGVIEISPLGMMRGRTLKNAFIIADEIQLATVNQVKMLLTRIGEGSQMVVTGDLAQADRGGNNGLYDFLNRIESVHSLTHVDITKFDHQDIERHAAVKEVLKIYGEE